MMWEPIEARLALLELFTEGTSRRRQAQAAAHDWLAELSWTRAGRRQGTLELIPDRRGELLELLDRVWPTWRREHLALVEAGEPPTPAGWRRMADRGRAAPATAAPQRLNRRTAAALTAPGAKSALTPARLELLGGRELTDDGLVRLRVPRDMIARGRGHTLALNPLMEALGEVGIPDRALRDGLTLAGRVRTLLLVENLGAWRDMPHPPGWMLAHVPGWNTTTLLQLQRGLGEVPVVHFGDLDPQGVRIHHHLQARIPGLGWLVPDFWRALWTTHAQPCQWPDDLDLQDAPPLVRELAAAGLWMEQEAVAVDPRLGELLSERA